MIAFAGVSTCREHREVLADIDLQVTAEEFVLLLGANGAGKSTLLKHINGILTPDSGTVTVDGRSPTADPAWVRQRIGMVFQEPRDQLIGATVASDVAFGPENLGLPSDEIDAIVEESLIAVGMSDELHRPVDELSHGEQTRVAIAGALAMNPQYLILDEPLVGLDAWALQGILDHLLAVHRDGTGIVLATHDVRDLWMHADRIIGMSDGRIVLDGSPSQVRSELASIGVRPP